MLMQGVMTLHRDPDVVMTRADGGQQVGREMCLDGLEMVPWWLARGASCGLAKIMYVFQSF